MSSLPQMMKALQIEKTGGPEVLQIKEIPTPAPAKNQILIKIEWAGINMHDVYVRTGLYPSKLPTILGSEAAGTIVALGEDVDPSEFPIGSRVATLGEGGFAEYIAISSAKVSKLPENVSTKEGAAAILQGLTALTFVTEAHEVKKGDNIMVHTVAGGLGLFFTELCKYRGATVFGTTSSTQKAELAKKHGADHVYIYTQMSQQEITAEIKKVTGGEGIEAGVNAVFDGVGKDTFAEDFEVLKRKGSLVTLGNTSGPAPPVLPLKLIHKNLRLVRPTLHNYIHTKEEFQRYSSELWHLVDQKVVTINIAGEYEFSLDSIKKAYTDLTGHSTAGKLVVKIA